MPSFNLLSVIVTSLFFLAVTCLSTTTASPDVDSNYYGVTDRGEYFRIGQDPVPGSVVKQTDSSGRPTVWYSEQKILKSFFNSSTTGNGPHFTLINDCDDNGNVNLYSTDGSPLVDDCMKMYNNIKGPGSWTVSGGWSNEHQLIQKDTCAFAARSTDGGWLYIGNDDIRLAIVKAMSNNNYKDSKSGRGKVGADGMLSCQSTPGIKWGTLHWVLDHSSS